MAKDNLKSKAVKGIMWTAIQKYSTMIAQFIAGIILARLLTPDDYGCVGMLSIFMVVANTMLDAGFGSALIQKKKPTHDDYSTVFLWNLGMSTVLYAILFFSAPSIASFYRIPLLSSVLRVQSLVLFLGAFSMVQRNMLRKQLRFRELSIIAITSSFIAIIVTVILAYKGFGVWALVAQVIVSSVVTLALVWTLSKWRPSFKFSKKSFKELFGFGFYMFLTRSLSDIGKELQSLLIGRVYNASTLGYYSKARSMERMSALSISQVMTSVTYPFYAQVQDDLVALQNMIKRFTSSIAYITFPLMTVLMLVAEPLFIFLYSDRWLPSVPYFQALCIAGIPLCLQAVNTQTIAAVGKSKVMFRWRLVKLAIQLSLMFTGLYLYGIWGVVISGVITTYVFYIINASLVSRHIGYKLWRQLTDLLPVLLLTLVSGITSFTVGRLLSLSLYVDGIVKFVVFVAVYIAGSFLFRLDAFEYFKGLLPLIFSKFRRKKGIK